MEPKGELFNDKSTGHPVGLEWGTPALSTIDISLKQNNQTTLSKVATGTSLYSLFCWLYDYFVYSIAIWYWGILWGGLLMAVISVIVDLVTLKFYDWSQEDWFAIEYLKSMKIYRGKNILKRFLGYVLLKTPTVFQVAVLSIKFNSFVVTTLLRDGAYRYRGFMRRDWCIFWSSNLVGQLYWIIVIGSGIELGSYIAEYF